MVMTQDWIDMNDSSKNTRADKDEDKDQRAAVAALREAAAAPGKKFKRRGIEKKG